MVLIAAVVERGFACVDIVRLNRDRREVTRVVLQWRMHLAGANAINMIPGSKALSPLGADR
jgi:hypothetical protein